jgi:hypothetical protein
MQADATPPERLLIVRGAPGTGRRFTKRLVRETVEAHGGSVATLDLANALADDAAAFAHRIAGALSAPLAAALASEALTTTSREVRDDVVPELAATWQQLARERRVWLVLEALGSGTLDAPSPVTDLVVNLVRQLAEYPLLRLVLIGWVHTAPQGFEGSIEDLLPPTGLDVAYHFTPSGEEPDDDVVAAADALLNLEYARGRSGYEAAHEVVTVLTERLQTTLASEGAT